MIPKNITRRHVELALEAIDPDDVPPRRRATGYVLIHEGRQYPPKYVLCIANRYANGRELELTSLGGGQESNNRLRKLGFRVEPIDLASGDGPAGRQPNRWANRDPQRSFSHAEAFPVIAGVILHAHPDAGDFVSHDTIVSALLSGIMGKGLVARARESAAWASDREAASNMVAWFSQQISVRRSLWENAFERERVDGAWAYRRRPNTVPEADMAAIEGEPRMYLHFHRERDPKLAEIKRRAVRAAKGELVCEACGFTSQAAYRELAGEVCEVHHRRPLGEVDGAVVTTPDDLAILCANCHRAIHLTRPLMSVETFRATFFGS